MMVDSDGLYPVPKHNIKEMEEAETEVSKAAAQWHSVSSRPPKWPS